MRVSSHNTIASSTLTLNPSLERNDWRESLIPQRIKKYPLNLWVKPGFSETMKPISRTIHPHSYLGFRLKKH
jgi:hypothetical protein